MVLKNLLAQAHEYSHILIVDSFLKNNVNIDKPRWLDEGMANYLDISYTDSSKFIIEEMLSEILEVKKDEDKLNEEEKIYFDNMIKILEENNIDLSNLDKVMRDKDGRIKVTTILNTVGINFSKLIIPKGFTEDTVYITGGESILDQKQWPMDVGNYINYRANFSFATYLIEEYGLEKLLYLMVEDFNTATYEEYFGKSYEELKIDWIKYIKENIKAIELIL